MQKALSPVNSPAPTALSPVNSPNSRLRVSHLNELLHGRVSGRLVGFHQRHIVVVGRNSGSYRRRGRLLGHLLGGGGGGPRAAR